ncbi:MAG: hypothetical protein JSS09_05495, partial [Verrucomicrobia bacterium]|nr:hypothetical protein [Verrucomicrobiota bacterium]
IGVLKSRSTSEATALEVCKEIDPYCTSYIFGNRVVRELRRDLIDTIKAKKEHKEYWQAIQEDLREQRPLSRISEASNSSKDPSSSKSWFYENL